MNFSLKHLLAITLLAVLLVNWTNNLNRTVRIESECVQLREDIETQLATTQYFEDKEQVYTRAFDVFENRKAKLLQAPEFFEPAAAMFRMPDTEDSDLVHIAAAPDRHDLTFGVDATYRICLPKSPAFELCMGFHEADSQRTTLPELRDSHYFSPNEQFTIPLNVGSSLVEFSYGNAKTRHSVLDVLIDGIKVHSTTRKPVLTRRQRKLRKVPKGSPEPVSIIDLSEGNSFEPGPLSLATINLWPTEKDPEGLSVILRPVVESEKRTHEE